MTCGRLYTHQYRGDIRRWYKCSRIAGHRGKCHGPVAEIYR